MTGGTGSRVNNALRVSGRFVGAGSLAVGLAVAVWALHERNLAWFAAGVLLVLLGGAFLVGPKDTWEALVELVWYACAWW